MSDDDAWKCCTDSVFCVRLLLRSVVNCIRTGEVLSNLSNFLNRRTSQQVLIYCKVHDCCNLPCNYITIGKSQWTVVGQRILLSSVQRNFCLSRDSSFEIEGNDKLYQRLTRQKIILTATFITIIRFHIAPVVVLSIPSGVDGAAAAAVQVVHNERQRSACLWRPWSIKTFDTKYTWS